jgi:hypothetical protein
MEQLALQEIYPEIRKIGGQLAAITPNRQPLPSEHPLAQAATQMGVGPEGNGRTFPLQQFPEARKSQHSSGLPTCLFVNRHAKMGLS